jgi:hypothetical protein
MLKLWLQVTLEDTVAEFFYAPFVLTLVGWMVSSFGLVDLPPDIFAAAAALLFLLFSTRAVRNLMFVRHADIALATAGAAQGKFRKWCEHVLHFSFDGAEYHVRHVFLKGEVEVGDYIVILSRKGKRESILVVHRQRDTQSLLR